MVTRDVRTLSEPRCRRGTAHVERTMLARCAARIDGSEWKDVVGFDLRMFSGTEVRSERRRELAPARLLRRHVEAVHGSMTLSDGTTRALDETVLWAPLEHALRAMSWGLIALVAAMAVARLR